MKIRCEKCRQKYEVDESYLGHTITCLCGNEILVVSPQKIQIIDYIIPESEHEHTKNDTNERAAGHSVYDVSKKTNEEKKPVSTQTVIKRWFPLIRFFTGHRILFLLIAIGVIFIFALVLMLSLNKSGSSTANSAGNKDHQGSVNSPVPVVKKPSLSNTNTTESKSKEEKKEAEISSEIAKIVSSQIENPAKESSITEEMAKSIIADIKMVNELKYNSIDQRAITQVKITNTYKKLIDGENYQCFEAEVSFLYEKSKRFFDVECGIIERGKRFDIIPLKIPVSKVEKWTFAMPPEKTIIEIDVDIKDFLRYAYDNLKTPPNITISHGFFHQNFIFIEKFQDLFEVARFPYTYSVTVSINGSKKYSGNVYFDATIEKWKLFVPYSGCYLFGLDFSKDFIYGYISKFKSRL